MSIVNKTNGQVVHFYQSQSSLKLHNISTRPTLHSSYYCIASQQAVLSIILKSSHWDLT